jgi:hypothetical protein
MGRELRPNVRERLRVSTITEEFFTPNQSINDSLNEMLAGFPEPSCSRMRRKIQRDIAALHKHRTSETERQCLHTFREFIAGWELFQHGYDVEYEKPLGTQTPDWVDETNKLVMEVFSFERHSVKVAADRISEKVARYGQAVAANSLHLVVAMHGTFDSFFDDIDCEAP